MRTLSASTRFAVLFGLLSVACGANATGVDSATNAGSGAPSPATPTAGPATPATGTTSAQDASASPPSSSADASVDAPSLPTGPLTKMQLALGVSHTCVLLAAGTVKCFGRRSSIETGYAGSLLDAIGDDPGEMGAALAPIDLGGRKAVAIAAGENHTCAVLEDGALRCWGANTYAQSGYGGDVDLGPGEKARGVAAGAVHTCVLLESGRVKCFGANAMGILGTPTQGNAVVGDEPTERGANLPYVDFGPGRTVRAIVARQFYTCATFDDGAVRCWGHLPDTSITQLGDAAGEMGANLPALNFGGHHATLVAAGRAHTCVRLDDASLSCWGNGYEGELGFGDGSGRALPMATAAGAVPLPALRTLRSVAAGAGAHTCADFDDGSVRCWGANDAGQLGLGDTQNRGADPSTTPASLPPVDLGRPALAIAVGYRHSCAILDDESVRCWGDNGAGQLGHGDHDAKGGAPGQMGAALPITRL